MLRDNILYGYLKMNRRQANRKSFLQKQGKLKCPRNKRKYLLYPLLFLIKQTVLKKIMQQSIDGRRTSKGMGDIKKRNCTTTKNLSSKMTRKRKHYK